MRPTVSAFAAITTTLLLAACAPDPQRLSADPSPSASVEAVPVESTYLADLEQVQELSDLIDEDADITEPPSELPLLTQVYLADQPSGSGPQIALRFLQALQRGDDVGADRELYSFGRMMLSGSDMRPLHRIMADVRRHARLAGAGRCSRAVALTKESAVVSCGRVQVVVHVLHDEYSTGVQISDWHVHHDIYRGPHTHAFTTLGV